MKQLLSVIVLLLAVQLAAAQTDTSSRGKIIRICAPSRGQLLSPPLYVITLRDQIIFQDTIATQKLNGFNPENIKSINILKDSASIAKYGPAAKNGVIEIELKAEKYPPGTPVFKPDSTKTMLKEKLK